LRDVYFFDARQAMIDAILSALEPLSHLKPVQYGIDVDGSCDGCFPDVSPFSCCADGAPASKAVSPRATFCLFLFRDCSAPTSSIIRGATLFWMKICLPDRL
jgi:hypothetical protein